MKKLIILSMVCCSVFSKAQQQAQYTLNQFNSSLEINPAYAGSNDDASASLRYRKQWVGFDGSPTTISFNGEGNVIKKKLGAGLTIVSDRIGITKSTDIDLSLASHVKVSETGTIALGIKGGIYTLKSDFSKLSNVDMTDPLYANDKISIPFVGVGALYYTKKLYIGFCIPKLVAFETATAQSPVSKPHYYLYGGYRVIINDEIELRPALLFKYVNAAPLEADIAVDFWYKKLIGLGISYRTSDSFNFTIKEKFGNFYAGYSYDMTISKLRTFNSGSHEVYLGYSFGKKGNPDRTDSIRL